MSESRGPRDARAPRLVREILATDRGACDGRIFLTGQVVSHALDLVNGAYHWLDLTSKGRDEVGLEWSMAWLRRHDAYEG